MAHDITPNELLIYKDMDLLETLGLLIENVSIHVYELVKFLKYMLS